MFAFYVCILKDWNQIKDVKSWDDRWRCCQCISKQVDVRHSKFSTYY